MRNDDIGAESDKFLGVLLGTIASRVGIAKLDLNVFTIRVAEGVQTAPECIGERMRRRRGHQHSNKGEFSWSLCARPKRPRRSHSADQRNELSSPHGHSLHARITHLTISRVMHHSVLAHPTSATCQPLPSATGFSISNPCPHLLGYLPCRAPSVPMALCAKLETLTVVAAGQ